MSKQKKSMMVLTICVTFIAMAVFVPFPTEAGDLEPSAPPGPTMKTLDEIPPSWSQILPASERFVLVMGDAGILDKETGLVWEQSPYTAPSSFSNNRCYKTAIGGRKGWRQPSVVELATLVDPSQSNPALPSDHPFSNVQSSLYWTATISNEVAWCVDFSDGSVDRGIDFSTNCYHWCVRGGDLDNFYGTGW